MEVEKPMVDQIRKGLIAWRPIEAGQVVSADDVAYARPATKLTSLDLPKVVGRRATRAFQAGEHLDAAGFGEGR
jgi:sialic acid synthase SpsE